MWTRSKSLPNIPKPVMQRSPVIRCAEEPCTMWYSTVFQ